MIRFQFFPRSRGITPQIKQIIDVFKSVDDKISSDKHELVSNAVLGVLRPHLEEIGYVVERGKSANDKIDVPVLFGKDNEVDKYFFADALSSDGTIVVEVEAGRATENNQFLKDIFEACMMLMLSIWFWPSETFTISTMILIVVIIFLRLYIFLTDCNCL